MVTAQVKAVSQAVSLLAKGKNSKPDASFSDIFNKENNASSANGSSKEIEANNIASAKFSKENVKSLNDNIADKANENTSVSKTDTVKAKDSTYMADKDVVRGILVEEPESGEQDEKAKDLMAIIMSMIVGISEKLEINEDTVKDFAVTNDLTSANLLDIDSWKGFVTEINGLDNISAILTNDGAFKMFGDISDIINIHLDEMGQMTAGMTEGVTDVIQVADNIIIPEEIAVKVDELFAGFVKGEQVEVEVNTDEVKEPVIEADDVEEIELFPIQADGTQIMAPQTQAGFEQNNRDFRDEKPGISVEVTGVPVKNLFDNIAESVQNLENTNSLPEGTTAKAILEQVTNQIKNLHAPDRTSLEFLLTPETLGKVAVNVSSKQGVLQAEFRVESAQAKAALESQMAELKLNFENQGLKVASVSVMISENGIGKDDQGRNTGEGEKKNSRRNRSFSLDGEEGIEGIDISSEGAVPVYTDSETGNNINLGA